MMTILFDSTQTRKPARRGFGLGIGRHARPAGPSDADRAWATYYLNRDARDFCLAGQSAPPIGMTDAELETYIEVRAAEDRLCRGYCC